MNVVTVSVWCWWLGVSVAGNSPASSSPTCCASAPPVAWPATAFTRVNVSADGPCGPQLHTRTASGTEWCLRVPPSGVAGDWARQLHCEVESRRHLGRDLSDFVRRVLQLQPAQSPQSARNGVTFGEILYLTLDLVRRRQWERDLEYEVWEAGSWRSCTLRVELDARAERRFAPVQIGIAGRRVHMHHTFSFNVTARLSFRATDGALLSRCTAATVYRHPPEVDTSPQ